MKKNSLRTSEPQIVKNLRNNEPWPKFTGFYLKKRVPTQSAINFISRFFLFIVSRKWCCEIPQWF